MLLGNTTGKITSQHGLFYDYLINTFSTDFAKGYLFNRKYFHAVRQMVNGCVLWLNELAKPTDNGGDSLKLVAYDIIDAAAPNYDTGELTVIDENVVAKRIHSNFSQSIDRMLRNLYCPNHLIKCLKVLWRLLNVLRSTSDW